MVNVEKRDRRYFILEASEEHANDAEYFKPIADLIQDHTNDTAELFYRWLMSRDLTGFRPERIPATAAKQAVINEARDTFDMWMQDVCLNPDILMDGGVALHITQNVYPDEAYRAYSKWCETELRGVQHVAKLHKKGLAKRMHRLLGTTNKNTKDSHDKRVFTVPPLKELKVMMKAQQRWDDATG